MSHENSNLAGTEKTDGRAPQGYNSSPCPVQEKIRLVKSGIYVIRNTLDGKMYIGQSRDIFGRLGVHRAALKRGRHINNYLQAAWIKHGQETFVFEVLKECSITNLDKEEIELIALFSTTREDLGYNLTPGGETSPMLDPRSREKVWTPERRARQAEAMRNQSPEHRAASSAAAKAMWTPEKRAKQSEHQEEAMRNQSPEHRAAVKAQWTPEKRAKRAETMRNQSPEQRAVISAAAKALWTPEKKAALAARNRDRKMLRNLL